MGFPTGPGSPPFCLRDYPVYVPPPPPPPPPAAPLPLNTQGPSMIAALPVGSVRWPLALDGEVQIEEALHILQLDPLADQPVRSLLRALARKHNASCLVALLRLGEIVEKPHHPCQHLFRAKTVEDVSVRLDMLERLIEPYGSCCDSLAVAAASNVYESLASMKNLPTRPELRNPTYLTPSFLRGAAESLWDEWPAGWRWYWMNGVEPILKHQVPREADFWGVQLAALLRDQPHPVLQITLRRLRGQDVEKELWWVNRAGLAKAALDRIVPHTDTTVMTLLKSEGQLYGM